MLNGIVSAGFLPLLVPLTLVSIGAILSLSLLYLVQQILEAPRSKHSRWLSGVLRLPVNQEVVETQRQAGQLQQRFEEIAHAVREVAQSAESITDNAMFQQQPWMRCLPWWMIRSQVCRRSRLLLPAKIALSAGKASMNHLIRCPRRPKYERPAAFAQPAPEPLSCRWSPSGRSSGIRGRQDNHR